MLSWSFFKQDMDIVIKGVSAPGANKVIEFSHFLNITEQCASEDRTVWNETSRSPTEQYLESTLSVAELPIASPLKFPVSTNATWVWHCRAEESLRSAVLQNTAVSVSVKLFNCSFDYLNCHDPDRFSNCFVLINQKNHDKYLSYRLPFSYEIKGVVTSMN